MKRNLRKAIFGLLGFFILFGTLSCNNIISPKETTQVSLSLDASFLQSNQQKNVTGKNIRSLETDGYQVSILLFQVPDSLSVTENQELDTATLTLLESITPPPVYSGDKVYATFNNVTIGIDAVIFVEIYENVPTDTSQNLVYKGNSKIFTVQEGENNVEITLQEVVAPNQGAQQEFTVTFDANGGGFADGNTTQQITVEEGTPVTAPEGDPTYHDKTFEYWAIQQEDDSFSEYNFSQPVTQNITLYAQWREVNQVSSVHFNPTTHTVDVGTEITLSCDTPDASIYYTTDGSDPTTSSSKKIYSETTKIQIAAKPETTIKAYAVKSDMLDSAVTQITYTLNQYTVQFVLNGGNFTENNKENPISVPSGTEVILKEYQVERSGYEFGGWYYDNAFTQPVDDSGIVTPSQSNTTSGTLTLYAKWEVVNNSITTLEALKAAITNPSEPIHVAGTFEIAETLTIDSPTTIIADATTTFSRAENFTGALFTNSSDFTLQGSENARITIEGNNVNSTAPAIKSTANLTIIYCNFENNTNTGTDGGAVFVDTTATVTFTASNCNFTNNMVTGSNMAGGAVAINATNSTSSFDTCNFSSNIVKQQGGGAIYISGNNATSTNALWHTFNNCTFTGNQSHYNSYNYGGAIYLQKGAIHLNSITMQENKYDQNGTSTQLDNSDIFLAQSATVLKLNGTIEINTLILEIPSNNTKNLGISDTFNTAASSIDNTKLKPVSGSITDGFQMFNIYSYDSIGTSAATTKQLISQQINCFKSIANVDGTASYTLNPDGTISPKS